MTVPTVKVEVSFTTTPDDPSPVWVDITKYVRCVTDSVKIDHGRQDWVSQATENQLALTLINSDGRFTPGNVNSPYYPNVTKDKRLRVSVVDNGVTYVRFTGYINEWPVTWADGSATVSDVRSQRFAVSRIGAWLGHDAQMRSIVENEVLFDGPSAYYPLGEPSGATQAGNVSLTVQPNLVTTTIGAGSSLNIAFGAGTGPGTDNLTAPLFVRGSPVSGAYLVAESPGPYNALSNGTLITECFFLASTAQQMGLVAIDGGATHSFDDTHAIGIDTTGHLTGRMLNGASTWVSLTSSAIVTDGQTHHAALREFQDNTGVTYDLCLDGVSVGNTFIAVGSGGGQIDEARRIYGGGAGVFASALGDATLSHLAVTWSPNSIPISRINQHYLAGHTGFVGEGSGARMARLAVYANVPAAQTAFDTGLSTSMDLQDTNGRMPYQLMQDVATTEGGILFDSTTGNLVFHDRGHRYNKLSLGTIQGSSLDASLQPILDDLGLVNDANYSITSGPSARAVDSTSVANYGTYRTDVQLVSTLDTEPFDAANWAVQLYSTPQVRIPVAVIELAAASTALKAFVLNREISDRITLAGLPKQAPASSMDFFIEGWSETITAESYRLSFYLSNVFTSNVWQLDSTTYSVLGVSTRSAY